MAISSPARIGSTASPSRPSSRSERGARTTAILYSLVENARLNNLDPAAYLLEAANAAIELPGTVTLP